MSDQQKTPREIAEEINQKVEAEKAEEKKANEARKKAQEERVESQSKILDTSRMCECDHDLGEHRIRSQRCGACDCDSFREVGAPPPLVESAKASGRYCHVTTYFDGPQTPIRGSLLFRTPEEARRCAEVLRAARRS